MHVNASDMAAAIENVLASGNTPAGQGSGYRAPSASPDSNLQGPVRGPLMASGGIVTSPTWAMIGEGGPEAVIPLSGSGLMDALSKAGRSGPTTIVLEIDGRAFANAIAPYTEGRVVLRAI